MNSWHSYSSIFNMGHKAIAELLKGPVYVEEKVDGSQFSFGLIETSEFEQSRGEEPFTLRVRSKGVEMVLDAPDNMFSLAVATVKELKDKLHPGWTYRCEYLRAPKHNALIYKRTPNKHLIIFDVEIGECEFLNYPAKWAEANRLGLEVVPLLFGGVVENVEHFRDFLEITSILGGQKIEGVVVKPMDYNLFGNDKKVLMGKFVSEAFKEVHSKMWRTDNPTIGDVVGMLGSSYGTQARWQKALQHLTEQGLITDAPQDIGLLMKEIPTDIKRECEEEIKDKLFLFAWQHISRTVVRGVPEWYKELLLKKQFEREDSNEKASVGQEASDKETQGLHSREQEVSAADQSQAGVVSDVE